MGIPLLNFGEREAVDASLIAQAIGFALYILSFFGFQITSLYVDIALRITGLFLVYSLLSEFLGDEMKIKINLLPLYVIMLLTQINPILRSYFPQEVLIRYAGILNDTVLVAVFVLLPLYLYLSGLCLNGGVKVFLFTVIVAYPVAQLYDLFVSNIVSFLAVVYLAYALLLHVPRGKKSPWTALKQTIQFDDLFVDVFLDVASRMDRKFFLVYSLLLFYLTADMILYVFPAITGYGRQDWYMRMLDLSYPRIENAPWTLFSTVALLIILAYPLLPDRIGKRTETMILTSPLAVLFLLFPPIDVRTLINPNAYGVVLEIKSPAFHPALFTGAVLFMWVFLALIGPKAGDGVLKLVALSFMLRYTAGYTLSTFLHIWTWYMHKPLYALLAGILGISYAAIGVYTLGRTVREILLNSKSTRVMLLPLGVIFFATYPGSVYSRIFAYLLIGTPLLSVVWQGEDFDLNAYIGMWTAALYAVSVILLQSPAVLALTVVSSLIYFRTGPLREIALSNSKPPVSAVLLIAGILGAYPLRLNPADTLPIIMIGGAFVENMVIKPSLVRELEPLERVAWGALLAIAYSAALGSSVTAGAVLFVYFLLESYYMSRKRGWEQAFGARLLMGIAALA
ncbi:hypothetical protein A3L09_07840 [Thermococcus profundus]|uniref:Uncharacterized protein n=1 Tax=Thermococcus profundus TaxID=49899 RepID=A0A2Z2M9F9_THEPR|nr:hypothetical protein [Thermococcus profundus]ASJ03170.1 hypothetical protein A3L09_07840 [Thermococcus profundus]